MKTERLRRTIGLLLLALAAALPAAAQDLWVPPSAIESFLSIERDEAAKPGDWAVTNGGKAEPPDLPGDFLYYRHEGLGIWIGPFADRSEATSAIVRLRALTRELAKRNPDRYATARAIRFRAPAADTIRSLYDADPNALELRWLMENYEQLEQLEFAREELESLRKEIESDGAPAPGSPARKVLEVRLGTAERQLNEVLLRTSGAPQELVRAVLLPGRPAISGERSERLRSDLGRVLARAAFPELDVERLLDEGMNPTQAKLLADTLRQGLVRARVPEQAADRAVAELAKLGETRLQYAPSAVDLALSAAGRELLESLAESAGFARAEARGGTVPSDLLRSAAQLADRRAIGGIGDALRVAAVEGEQVDPTRQSEEATEALRAAAGTIAATEAVSRVIAELGRGGSLAKGAWQPTSPLIEADRDAGVAEAGRMLEADRWPTELSMQRLAAARESGLGAKDVAPLLEALEETFGPQVAWQIAGAAGAATATGAARDISGFQVDYLLAELGRQGRVLAAADAVGRTPAGSRLDLVDAASRGLNAASASDFAEAVRQGFESDAWRSIGLARDAAIDPSRSGEAAGPEMLASARAWAGRMGVATAELDGPGGSEGAASLGDIDRFVRRVSGELATRSLGAGIDSGGSSANGESNAAASTSSSTAARAAELAARGSDRAAAANEWWRGRTGVDSSGGRGGSGSSNGMGSTAGGDAGSGPSAGVGPAGGRSGGAAAAGGLGGASGSAGSPSGREGGGSSQGGGEAAGGGSNSGGTSGGTSGGGSSDGSTSGGTSGGRSSDGSTTGALAEGRSGAASQAGGTRDQDGSAEGSKTGTSATGGGSRGGLSGEQVRGALDEASKAGGGGLVSAGKQPGPGTAPGAGPAKMGAGIGSGHSPQAGKGGSGRSNGPISNPNSQGSGGSGIGPGPVHSEGLGISRDPEAVGKGSKSGTGENDKGRGGGGSLPLPGSPIFEFIARVICTVLQVITGLPLNPDLLGQILYAAFPDVMENIAEELAELEEAIASDDVAAVFARLDKVAAVVGPLVGDITSAVDTLMDQGFRAMMKEISTNGLGAVAKDGLEKLARKHGLPPEIASGLLGLPNMKLGEIPGKLGNFAKKKVREELGERFGVPPDLADAIVKRDLDRIRGEAKDYAVDRLRKEAEKRGLPVEMVDSLAKGDVRGAFGEAYAKGARLDLLVDKGVLDRRVADLIRSGDFEAAAGAFEGQIADLPARFESKVRDEVVARLKESGVPEPIAESLRSEDLTQLGEVLRKGAVDALAERGVPGELVEALSKGDAEVARVAMGQWAKRRAAANLEEAGLDPTILDSEEAARLGRFLADAVKDSPEIDWLLRGDRSGLLGKTIRDGDLGPFISPAVPPELRDAMTSSLGAGEALPFVGPGTSSESIFSGGWIEDEDFHPSRVYGESEEVARALMEDRWEGIRHEELAEVLSAWGDSAGWEAVGEELEADPASLQRFAQSPTPDLDRLAEIGAGPMQLPPTDADDLLDRLDSTQRRLEVARQRNAHDSGNFVGAPPPIPGPPAPPRKTDSEWIAADARNAEGNRKYAADTPLSHWGIDYPAKQDKCNLFVHDVLFGAGIEPPTRWRPSISRAGLVISPFLAGEWADLGREIPGFTREHSPRPGDVIAAAAPFSNATGHVGIVVETESGLAVASVSSSTGAVVVKSIDETFPNPPYADGATIRRAKPRSGP